jgi:hypothetical protein
MPACRGIRVRHGLYPDVVAAETDDERTSVSDAPNDEAAALNDAPNDTRA